MAGLVSLLFLALVVIVCVKGFRALNNVANMNKDKDEEKD